jgi:adenosylcobinamide-phosphate synthase
MINAPLIILTSGFLLDLFVGDPPYPLHPVRIMGSSINVIERLFSKLGWNKLWSGILIVIITELFFVVAYISLRRFIALIHSSSAYLLDIFLFYSFIALKDLILHVRSVVSPIMERNLQRAREKVSRIVGRDVSVLDVHGISRATIESMAENFVDGFLSPIFWFMVGVSLLPFIGLDPAQGGIIFMIIFKVSSTIDSMIGYRNERYKHLGWAGARLDDFMNFIPARLSIFVLFLGAAICGFDPMNGLKVALKDRLKHESPNSAHAESFMAGALNIRLGGPQMYPYEVKNRPYLGLGTMSVNESHIRKGIRLIWCSGFISFFLAIAGIFFIYNF